MEDIVVKDNRNMTIGWVRDYSDRKVATHMRKGYVGSYIKNTGITVDAKGKIYCYGDGSTDLVRSADKG